MTIKPAQNYVLVEVKPLQTKNGIVLPKNAKASAFQPYGTVKAVGPGCNLAHVDDKIMFRPEEAIWLAQPQEDKTMTGLLCESSVLAFVEDDDGTRIHIVQ